MVSPASQTVVVTPESAKAMGLAPCCFHLSLVGLFGFVYQGTGLYAGIGGAPGGTFHVEFHPAPGDHHVALRSFLTWRFATSVEVEYGPDERVPYAGDLRPAVSCLAGASHARAVWAAVLVRDPVHAPKGLVALYGVASGSLVTPTVGAVIQQSAMSKVAGRFRLGPYDPSTFSVPPAVSPSAAPPAGRRPVAVLEVLEVTPPLSRELSETTTPWLAMMAAL